MAEGHTIHNLAGRLDRALAGEVPRVQSPAGTQDAISEALDGRRVLPADPHGKHLFLPFEGEEFLHVHLGMFGRFSVRLHRRTIKPTGPPLDLPIKGTLHLRLVTDLHTCELKAPMICELLDAEGAAAAHAKLGADPLRSDARPLEAYAALRASQQPIAHLLMEQSIIGGIGNVYRAEVLHRLQLDPFKPGAALTEEQFQAIWSDLLYLFPFGAASGRILTREDDLDRWRAQVASGSAGRPTPHYAVYQRAGRACPRCGEIVQAQQLLGRRLFWCLGCQTR
ncbi:MAG: DNA-formamidopyrimidine glycosylase family protein [Micrococcus sp.]|nr:DNA-formamidopyrimidine glycosylase family protein [Micrococcus sp.]